MNRVIRIVATLVVAGSASVLLAGTAAADPTTTCTNTLVCAPVNAPVTVTGPLATSPLVNGPLLTGLLPVLPALGGV